MDDKLIEDIKSNIKNNIHPNGFKIDGWTEDFEPFDYQKSGILWAYLTPRGLLADVTGSGKSLTGLAYLKFLKNKGIVSNKQRAIIIVPAISVYGSWEEDGFKKFKVGLDYRIGRGSKSQRQKVYEDPEWEVLLTNYETVRTDRELLKSLNFKVAVLDEADLIRNHTAQMTKATKEVTENCERVLAMTATPVQNNLLDLHSILEACGLNSVFGSKTYFDRLYHDYEVQEIRARGKTIYAKKLKNYKNVSDLKVKLDPYILRRTYKDLDVTIPSMKSQVFYTELTLQQKRLYEQAKSGYLKLSASSPAKDLKSAAINLLQICTSTYTVGGKDDHSGKFDHLINKLKNDWTDNKVVIFVKNLKSIEALETRLLKEDIGYVTISGKEPKQEVREERRQKFWNDPACRVLIGTTAIERSLNVQCANIQVNIDMMHNPARHMQLAGRVQRVGSTHKESWVFSYVSLNTIEAGMMQLLQKKQSVSDFVLNDQSEIFDALNKQDLYNLIRS